MQSSRGSPRSSPIMILSQIEANGISHRVATTWPHRPSTSRRRRRLDPCPTAPPPPPLIMFLHGWPESFYSWRHQLSFFATQGYRCCAPDMRGYGQTDAPANVSDYNVHTLATDVISIASALGHDRFVVVGHDFGSWLAWRVALLHPHRVLAVCGMSVPYVGQSPKHYGPLEQLQRRYGRCLDATTSDEEKRDANFHYMLHHCLPGAADEYGRNVQEALYRLYAYHPGVECFDETPEVSDKRMFLPKRKGQQNENNNTFDASSAPGWWKRLPRPAKLPPWLSQNDLNFYISVFKHFGFAGGLKWYQALDMNWEALQHLESSNIRPPALFIAGEEDGVIRAHGGVEFVRKRMEKCCENLDGVIMLEGAGHWIQQERAYNVNICLLRFLDKFVPTHDVRLSKL